MRWLSWFLLAPQVFLLGGLARDLGLPPIDVAVPCCLFLAWFARPGPLPVLLLAPAIGRALVDEASLPVQVLVIGLPVAALLPLRGLFFAQRWLWQAIAAALCAVAVPQLAALCGRLFDQPSAAAVVDGWQVCWSALLTPALLSIARRLPPCRAFHEVGP